MLPDSKTGIDIHGKNYRSSHILDFKCGMSPQCSRKTIDEATRAGEPHSCQSQS